MNKYLTREDFYGKNFLFTAVIWLILFIGLPLLDWLAMEKYPLEDCNNPVEGKIVLCTYLITLPVCFFFRKKIMPYGPKVPVIYVLGILSCPIFFVFFSFATFFFLNGQLDTGQPYSTTYSIVTKFSPVHSFMIQKAQERPILLTNLPKNIYEPAQVGSRIELKLSPGYFHQPWIKGYSLSKSS